MRGLRVLAVDDEADGRELLTAMLVKFGAEVKATESVSEALGILETWRPDVLMSDLEMPGLDGYWLIKQIRDLERQNGDRLPAIALTAHARTEDRERALQAGFQIHLAKPVVPSELKIILLELTAQMGQRATPALTATP